MLSMIMPLVPPVAAMAAVVIAPTFVHVIVPSVVVPPAVALNVGIVPPEISAVAACYQLDVVISIENLGALRVSDEPAPKLLAGEQTGVPDLASGRCHPLWNRPL